MVQWHPGQQAPGTLADVLDKVLDKGLVLAGDIQVSLANVELLTIKVRLLLCSVDKAQEIGLDWWKHDSFLSSAAQDQVQALQGRIETLEQQISDETRHPPASTQEKGDGPGRQRQSRRRQS